MNETGKMVKEWVRVEGYHPQELPKNPTYQWAIQVSINDWKHIIHQPKGNEEAVVIQSNWVFSPEDLAFMKSLSAKRALELLWEIRMRLVLQPTEFQMLPPRDGFPQGFAFFRQVSYDGGLTRHQFLDAMRELHRTELYVSWVVIRERELQAVPDDPSLRLTMESLPDPAAPDSEPAKS